MISIFNICGGVLYCNYENKTCVVKGTDLECKIETSEDALALDRLLWTYRNMSRVDHAKKNPNTYIPIIHKFQDPDAVSFTIDTSTMKNNKKFYP